MTTVEPTIQTTLVEVGPTRHVVDPVVTSSNLVEEVEQGVAVAVTPQPVVDVVSAPMLVDAQPSVVSLVEVVAVDVEEGLDYQYMGQQTIGDYTYFGYKTYGASSWKIVRRDDTDPAAIQVAYGDDGWTAAWVDPAGQSYGDPPS